MSNRSRQKTIYQICVGLMFSHYPTGHSYISCDDKTTTVLQFTVANNTLIASCIQHTIFGFYYAKIPSTDSIMGKSSLARETRFNRRIIRSHVTPIIDPISGTDHSDKAARIKV